MKSNWIDVSMSIKEDMMVYKNKEEKKPKIITRANHAEKGYHESSIQMDLHTGTHIDMPLHMLSDGHDSNDFSVESVNGPALLVDFSECKSYEVNRGFLERYEINPGDIVIIKTKNSFDQDFNPLYDYLDASGAEYLVEKKVKAVGIDALGIERDAKGHPTHKTLMNANIFIIEGLSLKHVKTGPYLFHCFPLKIENVEGLPARAFLEPI